MVKGISLLSGGLDSMLAICVLREQGIEMEGLVFQSPFFDSQPAQEAAAQLNVPLHVLDFTTDIFGLVRCPTHGFGGAMNPCIDCHAMMILRAGEFMRQGGYDFVSTGEVLNQRPMSQNRRSLEVVAESSGLAHLLLRPLSAQLLEPTAPELDGRVDRSRLCAISGRSRQEQLALVRKYGIRKYPSPAGGCLLTEKGFCRKLKDLFDHSDDVTAADVELLKYARHFRLPDGARAIVGRNRNDNQNLKTLSAQGKTILYTVNVPGPTAAILGDATDADLLRVAEILASYGDKGDLPEVIVRVITPSDSQDLSVKSLPRETY
ncbi:MAG: hypothetical protein RSB74_07360, partial [Kiritimatiellia bacterium]